MRAEVCEPLIQSNLVLLMKKQAQGGKQDAIIEFQEQARVTLF